MTLDEWYAYISAAPATSYQRGRIMAECSRLGIGDRAERLAICAQIAGLGELDSTRDLVWGDAGRIVRVLLDAGDRAELLDAAEVDDDQADPAGDRERPSGPTLGEAIRQLILCLHAIFTPTRKAAP